jgi:hypothetical protein
MVRMCAKHVSAGQWWEAPLFREDTVDPELNSTLNYASRAIYRWIFSHVTSNPMIRAYFGYGRTRVAGSDMIRFTTNLTHYHHCCTQ